MSSNTEKQAEPAALGHLDPEQAHALLQREPGAVLLDVRSRMEHDYVGHPPGALHVAWSEWPAWQPDPGFVEAVRAALGAQGRTHPERTPVLTLCRSGARSAAAGRALLAAGFQQVYNIDEGFEGARDAQGHRSSIDGWRCRGLPWEQS